MRVHHGARRPLRRLLRNLGERAARRRSGRVGPLRRAAGGVTRRRSRRRGDCTGRCRAGVRPRRRNRDDCAARSREAEPAGDQVAKRDPGSGSGSRPYEAGRAARFAPRTSKARALESGGRVEGNLCSRHRRRHGVGVHGCRDGRGPTRGRADGGAPAGDLGDDRRLPVGGPAWDAHRLPSDSSLHPGDCCEVAPKPPVQALRIAGSLEQPRPGAPRVRSGGHSRRTGDQTGRLQMDDLQRCCRARDFTCPAAAAGAIQP